MNSQEEKIRVAWQHPIIPNYRVPYLEKLANVPDVEVTSFHGQGLDGYTTKSVGSIPSVKNILVKNRYWAFGRGRIFWQSAVRKIIKGKFDVIVCEEVIHNASVWMLWLFAQITNTPLVLHGFGYRPVSGMSYHRKTQPSLRQHFIDRLRFFMIKRASAIAVYTEKGKEACIQEGIQSHKIFVTKNTYDTEYLMGLEQSVTSQELDSITQKLNLTDRFVLIFVGRLNPLKRVSLLIDVMRKLDKSSLQASLLVVGEGIEYQPLVKQSQGLAHVHFLGGIHEPIELAKLFMISHALVIPGLPGLTCVHGFCYGVPTITTAPVNLRWPECPELDYIRHGVNGYFVAKPDCQLFCDAIMYLADDKQRLQKFSTGARETAKSLPLRETVAQFRKAVKFAFNGIQNKALVS
ncbi:MAG: glycosyltransferase [Nitrospirales bacterium]|nr:glycosyltransferase [Nitrospira sp.]MDR4502671.1 glycosyltransferase [Nitrospirales bacterium]